MVSRRQSGALSGSSRVVILIGKHEALVDSLTALRDALGSQFSNVCEQRMPPIGLSWNDGEEAADLIAQLHGAAAVVFLGLSPDQLDGIFRLRLAQILDGDGPLETRSIIVLRNDSSFPALPRGFDQRAKSSWPFTRADFFSLGSELSDGTLSAIGLSVKEFDPAYITEAIARDGTAALTSNASPAQPVAMMVQPLTGRCGSSTAFENEIEELVASGCFVIRAHISEQFSDGETIARDWPGSVQENSINAGAHIEVPALSPEPMDARVSERPSGYDEFLFSLLGRYRCEIRDGTVVEALKRAEIVVMNHVISAGFVLKTCPNAKILLDTHDYFARWAFDHARRGTRQAGFPTRGELLRLARLEAGIWRLADVCTSVNLGERTRVARHNPQSFLVLPRPYVPQAPSPPPVAAWDALVSGDNHPFNVFSIRWLIESVLADPELRRLRIAIAGRVYREFDTAAIEAGAGVRFLGFVDDLEELRAQSRLTLAPDRAGTGIAVKTLTALASGHPLVSTSVGLRGFDETIRHFIPGHESAEAFAQDILDLLSDPARLAERRDACREAYRRIKTGGWSYTRALQGAPAPDDAKRRLRSGFLEQIDHLSADRSGRSRFVPGRSIEFRAGGSGTSLLGRGWHAGEAWGRWMDGHEALVKLPAGEVSPAVRLVVDVQAPVDDACLELALDGQVLGRAATPAGVSRLSFSFPKNPVEPGEARQLAFRTSRVICPDEMRSNGDRRILGMGVRQVSLIPPLHLSRPVRLVFGSPDADHVLNYGFYGREPWGRWTHGGEASLTIALDDIMDKPQVLVLDAMTNPLGCTLSLVVNGLALPARELTDGVSVWKLPETATANKRALNILFRLSQTYRPSEHTQSDDKRLLGIGLRLLHVEDQEALEGGKLLVDTNAVDQGVD